MNVLRLSGLLWTLDPAHISEYKDVYSDEYDSLANALMTYVASDVPNITPKSIRKFFALYGMTVDKRASTMVWSFLGLMS